MSGSMNSLNPLMNYLSFEDLEDVKGEISRQLFSGNSGAQASSKNDGDKDNFQDTLIYVAEVFEEAKNMKNIAKGQKSESKKYKKRYLCIILKKKMKIKIKKVKKNELTETYSFSKKTWNLEDIKQIELINQNPVFSITFNSKTRTWTCPNERVRIEFVYMVVKFCEKYMKKKPKYFGFNEVFLQKIVSSFNDEKRRESTEEITENVIDSYETEQKLKEETVQVNLEELLKDINWKASTDATALVERLYNELTEIEANNVRSIFECEEQANLVVTQLDSAISELDLIEDELIEYAKKLDDVGSDVKHIENQNQNLQTQTENQKLLYKELSDLLNKLCLPSDVISALYSDDLKSEQGIKKCEYAAKELIKKIEIDINEDLRPLKAVTEKLDLFNGYKNHFSNRITQCIIEECKKENDAHEALKEVKKDGDNHNKTKEKNKSNKKTKYHLQIMSHNYIQDVVFRYRKLILWLRDVDPVKHNELLMNYVNLINGIYKKSIKEYSDVLRSYYLEKKNEETDYVFEKSVERSNKIAQKIQNSSTSQVTMPTMKGDKKHKHFIRFGNDSFKQNNFTRKIKEESSNSINNMGSGYELNSDKIYPPDAITNTLNAIVPLMIQEQNFIINIFRLESIKKSVNNLNSNMKLTENNINKSQMSLKGRSKNNSKIVLNKNSTNSSEKDLKENSIYNSEKDLNKNSTNNLNVETVEDKKDNQIQEVDPYECWDTLDIELLSKVNEPIKDLKIKNKIFDLMNRIFVEFKNELITITNAGTQYDPTFSIGMMVRLEGLLRDFKNTDQQFVYSVIESVFKHLVIVFDSYMEKQFRAIDEYKNIKKKPQGVLPIIAVFPNFVDCLEYNLENNESETSGIVTITYERTSKKIFECIDALTKDVLNENDKIDDKDRLYIHILVIENMHFFYIEIGERQIKTLQSYILEAKNRFNNHLEAYKKIVINKTFGKTMDFFNGIELLLTTNAPEEVGYHFKYSKASLKSILRNFTRKDVKKGLESIYKQLFKHFTEETLIPDIWESLQNDFTNNVKKIEELISKCYANTNIKLEFTLSELEIMYGDIEKSK